FIGSDIIAGIIATKIDQSENFQLLVDLGTNGEIALGNKAKVYTCSVASGPAFEGGNISSGVPSIPGAITKIDIKNHYYETIANKEPIGFCGSGIIDFTSSLLKEG